MRGTCRDCLPPAVGQGSVRCCAQGALLKLTPVPYRRDIMYSNARCCCCCSTMHVWLSATPPSSRPSSSDDVWLRLSLPALFEHVFTKLQLSISPPNLLFCDGIGCLLPHECLVRTLCFIPKPTHRPTMNNGTLRRRIYRIAYCNRIALYSPLSSFFIAHLFTTPPKYPLQCKTIPFIAHTPLLGTPTPRGTSASSLMATPLEKAWGPTGVLRRLC